MKQIQAILIIIVALNIAACTGNKNSNTIEIHPDRFIRNQSGSILPMYHFDGNFIVKDNELFSVDTVDITFPVLENSIDTAYTFIYFHDDTIKVLSLNTIQGLGQTKDFIKERDLKSPYGVVSKKVWRTLYGEYSPWGVLLDEEGNIEEFGIWGNELLEELDKE